MLTWTEYNKQEMKFAEYQRLNRQQRKQEYKGYTKLMNSTLPASKADADYGTYIECTTAAEIKAKYASWYIETGRANCLDCKPTINPVTTTSGTKTMYYDFRDNLSPEKQYLLKRISDIQAENDSEDARKFIYRPKNPKSAADIVAAITAGNITVLSKGDAGYDSYTSNGVNNIIFAANWKQDDAAYEAARKADKANAQTAKDAITAGDLNSGLAALQAYQATRPSA